MARTLISRRAKGAHVPLVIYDGWSLWRELGSRVPGRWITARVARMLCTLHRTLAENLSEAFLEVLSSHMRDDSKN